MSEEKALPESARHAKNSRTFQVFRASLNRRPWRRTPQMKEVTPLKKKKKVKYKTSRETAVQKSHITDPLQKDTKPVTWIFLDDRNHWSHYFEPRNFMVTFIFLCPQKGKREHLEGNPACLQRFKGRRGTCCPGRPWSQEAPRTVCFGGEEGTALCSICRCPEEQQQELIAAVVVTAVVAELSCCRCIPKLWSRTPACYGTIQGRLH